MNDCFSVVWWKTTLRKGRLSLGLNDEDLARHWCVGGRTFWTKGTTCEDLLSWDELGMFKEPKGQWEHNKWERVISFGNNSKEKYMHSGFQVGFFF